MRCKYEDLCIYKGYSLRVYTFRPVFQLVFALHISLALQLALMKRPSCKKYVKGLHPPDSDLHIHIQRHNFHAVETTLFVIYPSTISKHGLRVPCDFWNRIGTCSTPKS